MSAIAYPRLIRIHIGIKAGHKMANGHKLMIEKTRRVNNNNLLRASTRHTPAVIA